MTFKNKKTNNTISASQEFIDSLADSLDYEEVIVVSYIPSFLDVQATKIKQLHENYSAMYKAYINSYSTLEVESFKNKADEAKAYMRDNTAPTPYVDAMANGDDVLRVELLNAIWTKVAYIASVEGQLVAKRDAIKACTTQEELDLIDIGF